MRKTAEEELALMMDERPRFAHRLGAGLAGALSLTAIHQAARLFRKDAPRMDLTGEAALVRLCKAVGLRPPRGRALYAATMVGDLLSNAGYYALWLTGRSRRPWMRGTLAGAAAGLGALTLPRRLGIGRPPRSRHRSNRLMTVAWYLLGGLTSAAVYRTVARRAAV
jgi:hypothetical protein